MKNLVVILFMLPSLAFGQQFLWSTIKSDSLKGYIPLERVPDKLVEYYRTYDKFFDGSGFSKDTFIETIEKNKLASSKEYALFKKIMDRVDQPTVMALKANDGKGSYITIMNMDENNVDLIVFSNNSIVHPMEYTTDLGKFKMLYKTLFSYGRQDVPLEQADPLTANYGEGGSGFGDASLSLANRRFVVSPQIEDDGKTSGKVAVEVRVDREGKIISARAGVRGTTISNNALYEKCERAALGAKLNALEKAPPVQTGVIVFNFKLK